MTERPFTVLAPAFYPNDWMFATRYLRLSAAACEVPIHFYGTGEPYPHWLAVQVDRLLDEIRKTATPYILYTDASDAIFLATLEEIEVKHEMLGSPNLLMSVEPIDGKVCAGGWLAERETAIECLELLKDYDDPNPQTRWREAIEDGMFDGLGEITDASSIIFQVTGCDLLGVEVYQQRRIYNPGTQTLPSILHFAGGYTDPKIGKADLVEPVWRGLGYEPTI